MKKWFFISGLLLMAIFIACKKDTGPITPSTELITPTQPQPYVEYRNPFVGTFVGTRFSSSAANYNGVKQPVDSITTYNVIETLTKSTTHDSGIVSKLFNREFRINGNGEGKFNYPLYPIMEIYTVRFKNDSVYIYRWYNIHGGTTNIAYVNTFKGKKQ